MARDSDLKLIEQGVEVWNRERARQPGHRPDLRNAVLRGMDLAGADLRQADLTGADLSETKLQDADLHRAELSRALLSGADLTSADLVRSVLTESDLTGAVLRDANLVGSQLGQARLHGTDLERADLSWVSFERSDLSNASLRQAVLIHAVFHRPVFEQTDFTGALVASTIFAGADLRQSVGLDQARFRSPAELTLSTFFLSKGRIPEALLRGAEVPLGFLEQNQDLFGRGADFFSCFISYSRQDREFAQRLYRDLSAQGVQVWLDDHQVLPGDVLYDAIDRGIRHWDKVLLCCSQSSLHSSWVDFEVTKALQKEEKLWRERGGQRVLALIPINLDGYLFRWQDGKASVLTSRFAPDFGAWRENEGEYQQQLERLLRALRISGEDREKRPESRL